MKPELICEVSSNHGGDLELAKAFIWQCAEAGADWVKFQSYQVRTLRPDDPQRAWLAQAELSDDAHHVLKGECARAQVQFLTTVFHASRVPFLASLGLPAIKIGSGESNERSLAEATRVFPQRFVSVNTPSSRLRGSPYRDAHTRFLACISRYPAPHGLTAQLFAVPYGATSDPGPSISGWSDHCIGLESCQVAIYQGATVIEKHVYLPEQKRPIKAWEASMTEIRELRAFMDDNPSKYEGRWQQPTTS